MFKCVLSESQEANQEAALLHGFYFIGSSLAQVPAPTSLSDGLSTLPQLKTDQSVVELASQTLKPEQCDEHGLWAEVT